jgi:Bacterial Ig domain
MKIKSTIYTLCAVLLASSPFANAQGPSTQANNDLVITSVTRGPILLSNLLANDTDPENDPLTIINVSNPQFGKVEIRRGATTSVFYTPSRLFAGTDSFIYSINDRPNGLGNSSAATVTIRNPFLIGRGVYGSRVSGEGGAHDVSGYLTVTVTGGGDFTAVFRFAGAAYRFRGRFDLNGNFSGEIARPGLPPLQLALLFAISGETRQITGNISFGAENVPVVAPRIPWSFFVPTPNAGRYNFVLPPPDTAATTPQGNGFGLANISRSGSISFTGRTGDNRAFTSATHAHPDGVTMPLYGIVRTVGTIQGDITSGSEELTTLRNSLLTGSLRWFAVRNLKRPEFPLGFDLTVETRGAAYVEPRPGSSVLETPKAPPANGSFTALSGNLPAPRLERATLGNRPIAGPYAVAFDNSKRMAAKLNIAPRTGMFTGSFYDTRSRRTFSMAGVFVQGENKAFGLFKTPKKTGQVELVPDPLDN